MKKKIQTFISQPLIDDPKSCLPCLQVSTKNRQLLLRGIKSLLDEYDNEKRKYLTKNAWKCNKNSNKIDLSKYILLNFLYHGVI